MSFLIFKFSWPYLPVIRYFTSEMFKLYVTQPIFLQKKNIYRGDPPNRSGQAITPYFSALLWQRYFTFKLVFPWFYYYFPQNWSSFRKKSRIQEWSLKFNFMRPFLLKARKINDVSETNKYVLRRILRYSINQVTNNYDNVFVCWSTLG